MAKKPILDGIISEMKKGKDFTLTRSQYLSLTGTDIPQDKSYTEKRSAVAKRAAENGYYIQVVPEVLQFRKK